ncbi:hypothetical protein BGZ68_007672 [Mortierella alpina]|nr:hypothetical protein BGZ68_007672 [Mortierella alpina]
MSNTPAYDPNPSSTPNPQRATTYGHAHHPSFHRTAQPSLPDDSFAAGRQRVRTEPSPRHQHTSSTWLGPYNEQLSPAPASRSPRGSRQAAGRHSPSTLDRAARSGPTAAGSDRIMETHRALGGWQLDGSSTSSSSATVRGLGPAAPTALSAGSEGAFKRRDFEPRHSDTGFAGPLIEPSTSVQSLVETIDDDHVFKLTELTKKRVEHNNPAQKRQRVVSLPATEAAFAASLQPSEKTLVFSSTCKAHLESKYTQLYQSINAGHPINRLQKLREVLPRIKEVSLTRPSLDLAQSRPRRSKSEKYRFVDKVEESSCIWDVDHMEAKAAAEATAEAAALARQTALLGVRNTSQPQLGQSTSSLSQDSYLQSAPSTSTESLKAEILSVGEPSGAAAVIPNRPIHDSPSTSDDAQRVPERERMDDSQDESDSGAANMNKRSSLRRLKDRMTWKRGNKALSAIQQGESAINSPTSPVQGRLFSESNKSLGKKTDPALAYLQGPSSGRLSTSQPSSGRNSLEGSSRPKLNFRVLSSASSPVLDPLKSPETVGTNSPRTGPISGGPADAMNRLEKSPMTNAVSRAQKSPMLNPARMEKSPLIGPASVSGGEEASATVDSAKQNLCVASQLMVDVERLPKRLLQELKERPDLASIDWSSDTVDLSVLWSSPEPVPTYHEFIGISSAMKASQLYPSYLDEIDVLDLHLTLSVEEPRDAHAKNRARKWDMLELRVDQELHQGEKWIKEVERWSENRIDAVERHQRADNPNAAVWHLNDGEVLVEEPDEEVMESREAQDLDKEGQVSLKLDEVPSTPYGSSPSAFSMEALKARKQKRDLSLISGRGQSGSISSFQTSITNTFTTSLESTRESVKEMRVFLVDCRQRLQQLHEATGAQLREKEPVFKEVVDKFTMEWNESYFVRLKEVEDQIQVMNLKRIENPWMDMLLIMLSWLIRGLFYIVEGVTIMIIIGRHAWSKAKQGYDVLRNARQGQEEQERLMQGRGAGTASISQGVEESQTNGNNGSARVDKQ